MMLPLRNKCHLSYQHGNHCLHQALDLPHLDRRIATRRQHLVVARPSHARDAVLVGVERLDALARVGQAPDEDVGVERAAGGELLAVVPGDGGDASRVGRPAVRHERPVALLGVVDLDLAARVADGQVGALGREGQRRDDRGRVGQLDAQVAQRLPRQLVHAHHVVLAAHGHEVARRRNRRRRVRHRPRADLLAVLEDGDRVGRRDQDQVAARGHALGLVVQLRLGAGEGLGVGRDGAQRVVPADAVHARLAALGRRGEGGDVVAVRLAVDAVGQAGLDVPGAHAAVVAARVEGRVLDAGGGDVLGVAAHDLGGLVAALVEVVQVAVEVDRDDGAVAAPRGPRHADLLVADVDDALVAQAPRLHVGARLGVPYPHRLVGAGGDEALRVAGPRDAEDAAGVHILADLRLCLARLAVVQPDALVGADGGQVGAVRAELGAEDEAIVLAAQAGVELEGGAVVEDHAGVVAAGGGAQGPLLADGDAVDLRRVAGNLAHAVAAIPGDAVAEALLALANGYDALRVAIPRQVVDAAGNDVVVAWSTRQLPSVCPQRPCCPAVPFVAPSPTQSQTLTAPDTSPLAT